jgi:endonuclease G
MKKHFYKLLFVSLLGTFTFSCQQDKSTPEPSAIETNSKPSNLLIASGFPEGFEGATKGSYAVGSATFGSGSWTLDEALVGSLTGDAKNGLQSVRIRDLGKLTMNFAYANGAGTVTVKHAKYGTDGNSTWELWMSNNGGAFTKVGSTITTSTTTLATATFAVNVTGTVKFEIRKTTGSGLRINIDDFSFDDYGSGGGGGTADTGGSTTPTTDNSHLMLGNPSAAVTNTTYYTNYLMQKNEYAMSYHRDRGTPNWVAWYVGTSWLGSTARQDDFRADATLPAGWYQVGGSSYVGSGFDRGHNCPSADRTNTVTANSATFLMSNMIPQAPNNNQQTWANLENYARTLVDAGNEVYIVMGSYGTGGSGTNGYATTINTGKVTVPNRVWKVLVVIPNGSSDFSRITTSTRVIAVNTPNDNTVSSSWGTYRTSVDAIEAATGYNLLSNLSTSLQTTLEAQIDNGPTN